MKYRAFAHKALEEGHPEVAQVFHEVAGSETTHGMNHLRVSGDVKSTIENLQSVIEGESKEIVTRYPNFVKDAVDEGRIDAAETFTLVMDQEMHHLEIFHRAVEALEAKLAQRGHLAEGEMTSTPREAPTSRLHRVTEPAMSTTYTTARTEVEGQRWRVAAKGRIREVVFGAQDGLLSTVALVTAVAVSGIGEGSTPVLIAGLAGALASMLSMSTGAYLGSKAEQDIQKAEIAEEARELEEHPAEELAELVVLYQREGLSFDEAKGVAEHVAADKDLWLRTLVEKELGFSPEITSEPIKDAFTMGAAFSVAAVIPILPYFFIEGSAAVGPSIAGALVGLFILGVWKGRIVQKSPILQGLEILLIGAVSAGVGYGLGEGIPRLFS